jgi:uncharacterized membrane protein YkoI
MNTKNLGMNQKMLAIIIGVAIIATAGVTAASAQVQNPSTSGTSTKPQIAGSINVEQILLSKVQTKFSTASDTAANAVSGGQVIGGSLKVVQGSLVYSFKVIDAKNMVYTVIIDPANGSVLYTSPGHAFHMGGFGAGHGGMKHGGHMGNSKAPSGSAAPSSVTPSTGSQ